MHVLLFILVDSKSMGVPISWRLQALPLYSRVVSSEGTPKTVVLPACGAGQKPQDWLQDIPAATSLREGDLSWGQLMSFGSNDFQPHVAEAYEVSNVLFSSGTTGG